MTEEQKNKLCDHVVEAFKNFSAEDVAMIVPLLMANGPLQKIVLQKVVQFITDEMRLQVIDWWSQVIVKPEMSNYSYDVKFITHFQFSLLFGNKKSVEN